MLPVVLLFVWVLVLIFEVVFGCRVVSVLAIVLVEVVVVRK